MLHVHTAANYILVLSNILPLNLSLLAFQRLSSSYCSSSLISLLFLFHPFNVVILVKRAAAAKVVIKELNSLSHITEFYVKTNRFIGLSLLFQGL